jgi:hypothetical protein
MRHFGSLIISFGIKIGWHPQDFRLDDEEGDYEWSRPHGSVSLPVGLCYGLRQHASVPLSN